MKKQAVHDFEKRQATRVWPEFSPGDTVVVSYRIAEGETERVQTFKGTVIGRQGEGMGRTFTVRKMTQGVGVERTYPLQSPLIADIKIEKRGMVRRAKLYYLRHRAGRSTRITERLSRHGVELESGEAQPAAASADPAAP